MSRWFHEGRYEAECAAWDEEHPIPGVNQDESFHFRLRVHVPRWNGRRKVEEAMRRFREYNQNPEPVQCVDASCDVCKAGEPCR